MEKNKEKKELKYDEDGHIIVAESVPIILSGELMLETIKKEEE